MTTKRIFPAHEEQERDALKREIAADHAENEFRTKDPSVWQWAKAYDYVEEQFGNEHTEVLQRLAEMGRPHRRSRPTRAVDAEASFEASFA